MMDEKKREQLMAIFEKSLNTMGESFTNDYALFGLNQAVSLLEMRVRRHLDEQGPWHKAKTPDLMVAGMIWSAAELLIGAFVNGGVWRDDR